MKRMMMVVLLATLCLWQMVASAESVCYGGGSVRYESPNNPFVCGEHGNCVWWAAYKRPDVKAFEMHSPVDMGPGTSNTTWISVAEDNSFATGSAPRVGATVVFEYFSHVAHIESVGGDGEFDVTEMDWTGSLGTHYGVQEATYHPQGGGRYRREQKGSGVLESTTWQVLGFIHPRYCVLLDADAETTTDKTKDVLCWNGNDGHFAECFDGSGFSLYRKGEGNTLIATPLDGSTGVAYCTAMSVGNYPYARSIDLGAFKGGTVQYAAYGGFGYGSPGGSGDGGGSDPPPTSVNLRPDLDIEDCDDHELVAGTPLYVGQTVCAPLQIKASGGDVMDHIGQGKEAIESKVRFCAGSDCDSRIVKFTAGKLDTDDNRTLQETFHITIEDRFRGTELCFQGQVDTGHDVTESDEGDNNGRQECYPVSHDPLPVDFIVSGSTITPASGTVIGPASPVILTMLIRNNGLITPSGQDGSRASYQFCRPDGTGCTEVASDGMEGDDLQPNHDHSEQTNTPVAAPGVGNWIYRACANWSGDLIPETTRANNCTDTLFTVQNLQPQVTITDLWLDVDGIGSIRNGGSWSLKKGESRVIHPNCTVQSTGQVPPTGTVTVEYFIDDVDQNQDDHVDPGELLPGMSITERVNGNELKPGKVMDNRRYTCRVWGGGVPTTERTMVFSIKRKK